MKRRMSYEDDEDLESLRLAALQTLNPRPKVAANPIQVVESVKPRYQEEIYPEVLPERGPFMDSRIDVLTTSGVSNGVAWVPPPPTVQLPLPDVQYVPPYVAADIKPDVQLSPRSAAFVLQNNSILRRRKGDKSPSISPPPYKSSLAVPWDPPSPEYAFRRVSRSRSKSPEAAKSPIYRHRSPASPKRFYSRSPVRRERSLTRSPHPAAENYRNRRRTRSRSPPPPPVRRPSPRFVNRSRNSSPRPVRSRRQSRDARSPHRAPRKASRSPVRPSRNRSHSPAAVTKRTKTPPARKPRRARDPPARRRSVERHPLPRGKNDRRPRRDDKRPSPRPRKRSRSVEKPSAPAGKTEEKKKETNPEEETKEKTPEITAEENQENPGNSEEHQEEDPASDVENAAADEIDLFASEESESENEGRFKSSSSKTERSAPTTVSFSKLVSEPLSSITDLKELPTLSSVSRASSRERRSERSSRDYGRGRRKRERDRRSVRGGQRDTKSSSTKDSDKDSRQKNAKNHGESNMKMFKSTFQAVVVNDSKKQAVDSASADKSVKDSDKRKIIQIKKPISFKESKDKAEEDPSSSSSSLNGQQQPPALGVGADGKVKKSIHLRLGGYAPANGESGSSTSASSLASVFASSSSKVLKSGNLANLKKSWKTSEKVSMKYCLMILSRYIF